MNKSGGTQVTHTHTSVLLKAGLLQTQSREEKWFLKMANEWVLSHLRVIKLKEQNKERQGQETNKRYLKLRDELRSWMRGLDLKKMDYLGGFQFQVTEKSAPNCSSSRFIGSYIRKLRQWGWQHCWMPSSIHRHESWCSPSWVSVSSGQRFISPQSWESHMVGPSSPWCFLSIFDGRESLPFMEELASLEVVRLW